MKEIFDMIVESPVRAFAFLLMLACTALITILAKMLFKRFTNHEEKMQIFSGQIEQSSSETRSALASHAASLSTATKTIDKDIKEIHKNLVAMKMDLLERTGELEQYARELEQKTMALSHVFEVNIEKFNLKFGSIIDLRKEVESVRAKIARVEQDSGQFKILSGNIDKLARVLKIHDDMLKGKK